MRAILIFANILLAGLIALGASQWLGEPDVNAEIATSVTKERKSSTPQVRNVQQQQQMMQQRRFSSVTPENQIATTVALNIFDSERAPQATTARRAATPVNRNDMTLVGTFTIGDIAGAIILQRNAQMMRNMQMMGRNNQNGTNTNNAEELAAAQEQQMQQALDNRNELNTLLQTLQQTQGVTDEQTALIRQRLERSNQQIELLQNQNQQRNTGRDGVTADGTMATANASNSNKQYIRVGEALSNGYTLAAVTRTSATLTRNQETIELAMADASANAGRGGMAMGGAANRLGGAMGGFGGGMDFGGGGRGGRGGGMGGGGMDFGGGGFGGGGMGGGPGGGMGGGFGGGMGGGPGGGMGGGFGGGGMGGGANATFGGGGGGNNRGGNNFGGGNNRGGGNTTGGGNNRGGGTTTTRTGGGNAGGGNNRGGGRGGR